MLNMSSITPYDASHALQYGRSNLPQVIKALRKDERLRTKTLESLTYSLLCGDRDGSNAAARALGRLQSNECFEALYRGLFESPKAGWTIAENLGSTGPLNDEQKKRLLDLTYEDRALAVYMQNYPSTKPERAEPGAKYIQHLVIFALGSFASQDQDFLDRLVEVCTHEKDMKLRTASLSSMGRLGNIQATSCICSALADVDEFVAAAAARALGELKDPAGVQPLVEHLRSEKRRYPYGTGIVALAQIGDERGIESVINSAFMNDNVLKDEPLYRRDEFGYQVMHSLSMFEENGAVAFIERYQNSDPVTQAHVLARIIQVLNSDDEQAREFTTALLDRLHDPRAAEALEICRRTRKKHSGAPPDMSRFRMHLLLGELQKKWRGELPSA